MLSILQIVSFEDVIELVPKHHKVISVYIANFKSTLALYVLKDFPR